MHYVTYIIFLNMKGPESFNNDLDFTKNHVEHSEPELVDLDFTKEKTLKDVSDEEIEKMASEVEGRYDGAPYDSLPTEARSVLDERMARRNAKGEGYFAG